MRVSRSYIYLFLNILKLCKIKPKFCTVAKGLIRIPQNGVHKSQTPGRTATKFCTVTPKYFKHKYLVFPLMYKHLYHFTCSEETEPDTVSFTRLVQTVGL
jgi:hypothetical protein